MGRASPRTSTPRPSSSGAITYLTRHGTRVAAVVPLNLLPSGPEQQEPSGGRPEAEAEPGCFEANSQERDAWTLAALEALHGRLSGAATRTAHAIERAGKALAAAAAGDTEAAERLVHEADVIGALADLNDAEALRDALTHPDKASCQTCGTPLGLFPQWEGYQHYRPANAGNATGPVNANTGLRTEVFTPEDGHTPRIAWSPRPYPAIRNGRIVTQA